jgi:glucokinase
MERRYDVSLNIGVDIGGTKVAAGVVDKDGRIIEKVKRATPARNADASRAAILDVVRELLEHNEIEAIGLGAPGFVDESRSTVLMTPNINWRHEPLRAVVEDAVGIPAVVENDANAATWAEARFGAGRGERHLVCVTVGTGIGGGLVLDGELYRGRWGLGAEVGHVRVVPDGRLCGCGNRGCWEQYASGNALLREARARAAEERADAVILLELGEGTPEGVTGQDVTEAARLGDVVALEAFETTGHWLGQGLADLAAILDPACFVIGGGVSEAGDLLLGPARESFATSLTARAHRPMADVRVAELGNDAGMVGAADLARRR